LPSKRPADRFNDIISNIDAIGRYVAGMTEEQFRADERTIDATEPLPVPPERGRQQAGCACRGIGA
jgi:hypothetical protein